MFAGILVVSVQSQAICKGKISHFPHCERFVFITRIYVFSLASVRAERTGVRRLIVLGCPEYL